jgi:hypothetical protein
MDPIPAQIVIDVPNQAPLFSDAVVKQIATDLLTQYGAAATSFELHLFTNNPTITIDSLVADFTEVSNVDWPSYAPTDLINSAGLLYKEGDEDWMVVCDLAVFQVTGAPLAAPVTVTGWFITDSAGALFKGGAFFPNAITVQDLLDAIVVLHSFKLKFTFPT